MLMLTASAGYGGSPKSGRKPGTDIIAHAASHVREPPPKVVVIRFILVNNIYHIIYIFYWG
jgi:hypothetical protein